MPQNYLPCMFETSKTQTKKLGFIAYALLLFSVRMSVCRGPFAQGIYNTHGTPSFCTHFSFKKGIRTVSCPYPTPYALTSICIIYTDGKKFKGFPIGHLSSIIFLLADTLTCLSFENDLMATRKRPKEPNSYFIVRNFIC